MTVFLRTIWISAREAQKYNTKVYKSILLCSWKFRLGIAKELRLAPEVSHLILVYNTKKILPCIINLIYFVLALGLCCEINSSHSVCNIEKYLIVGKKKTDYRIFYLFLTLKLDVQENYTMQGIGWKERN